MYVHINSVHKDVYVYTYMQVETCIIEMCVGIRQVAKERDTQKGPKAKQVLEWAAPNLMHEIKT